MLGGGVVRSVAAAQLNAIGHEPLERWRIGSGQARLGPTQCPRGQRSFDEAGQVAAEQQPDRHPGSIGRVRRRADRNPVRFGDWGAVGERYPRRDSTTAARCRDRAPTADQQAAHSRRRAAGLVENSRRHATQSPMSSPGRSVRALADRRRCPAAPTASTLRRNAATDGKFAHRKRDSSHRVRNDANGRQRLQRSTGRCRGAAGSRRPAAALRSEVRARRHDGARAVSPHRTGGCSGRSHRVARHHQGCLRGGAHDQHGCSSAVRPALGAPHRPNRPEALNRADHRYRRGRSDRHGLRVQRLGADGLRNFRWPWPGLVQPGDQQAHRRTSAGRSTRHNHRPQAIGRHVRDLPRGGDAADARRLVSDGVPRSASMGSWLWRAL